MVSKGVFDIRGKGFLFTYYFALNHLYHFDLPSRFILPESFVHLSESWVWRHFEIGYPLNTYRNWQGYIPANGNFFQPTNP